MEEIKTEKSRLNKNMKRDITFDGNESSNYIRFKENLQLIISLGGFLLALCYYHYALYKIKFAEYWGYPENLMNENQLIEGVRVFQMVMLMVLVGSLIFIIFMNSRKRNSENLERVSKKFYWTFVLVSFSCSVIYSFIAIKGFRPNLDTNLYSNVQVICICFLLFLSTVIIIIRTKVSPDYLKSEEPIAKISYVVPRKLSLSVTIILIIISFIIIPFQLIKSDIENVQFEDSIQIVTLNDKYRKNNPELNGEFYIVKNDKDNFLIRKIIMCSNKNNPIYCFENEYRTVKSEEIKKISSMRFYKKNDERNRLKAIWIIEHKPSKL